MLVGSPKQLKKVIILNGRATKITMSHSTTDSYNLKIEDPLPILHSAPLDLALIEKVTDFDNWAHNFVDLFKNQTDGVDFNDANTNEQFLFQMENINNAEFFSICMKTNSEPFSPSNSAIDDDFVFNFFNCASHHPEFHSISQKIIVSSTRYIVSSSKRTIAFKKLRLICFLLYLPTMYQNADQLNIIIKVVGTFSKVIRSVFSNWLSSLPHLLSRIVGGCQFLLDTFYINYPHATSIDTSQSFIFETLDLCYESNHVCRHKLPLSAFYNKNIDERASGKLLLPFPFVLSFRSRLKLCRTQTKELQVSAEVDHMMHGCDGRLDVYLRRSSYFSDFQKYFLRAKPSSFYRRLKVTFVDESAVDAGGPQKECLRMVTDYLREKILRIIEKRLFWFKRCPLESEDVKQNETDDAKSEATPDEIKYMTKEQKKVLHSRQRLKEMISNPVNNYRLLGIVVGLAVANEITLPIRFPKILYSQLIKTQQKVTMADFSEVDPVAASSLQSMINMKRDGGDVSQLFMTFEITNDEGETIDLNSIKMNTDLVADGMLTNKEKGKRLRSWQGAPTADGSPTIYSIAMATAIQKVSPLQKVFRPRRSSAAASIILKGNVPQSMPGKTRNTASFTTNRRPSQSKISGSKSLFSNIGASNLPSQSKISASDSLFNNIQSSKDEIPSLSNNQILPVTNDNVESFVIKYIAYEIYYRYSKEIESFRSGFEMACPSPYTSMLTAEELDVVISGAEEFDWGALVAAAKYKDGLDANSEEVKWFWSVFWEFSEEQRIEFLKFTTGSDRAPFGGLGKVRITFRKGGKQEMLPVAHTCFNMFFLPKYRSKEEVKKKLLLAFKYSEGFGIE